MSYYRCGATRRNFGRNGMTPAYRREREGAAREREILAGWDAQAAAGTPLLTTAELLAMAQAAGLNAYIVPSHGRLLCEHPRGPYPTEIRNAADVERLAALLPARA